MLTELTEDDLRRYGRGEAIARRMRDAICKGVLRPGERLTEVSLAKTLGVSRTPVREAIEKLLAEGLLSSSSGRGVIVTELSRAQVMQIYALRAVLEGAAAAFAAQHASPAEIDELMCLEETIEKLVDSPERSQWALVLDADQTMALYATYSNVNARPDREAVLTEIGRIARADFTDRVVRNMTTSLYIARRRC